MSDAPRWPLWTIPAVLLGSVAVLLLAGLVAVLAASLAGADGVTPATVLLASALTLAGVWLMLRLVADRAGVDDRFGLRAVTPRMTLVLLGFGAAVALAAAGLTALLADVDLPHPDELGGERAVVPLDAGTAASVLARAVIAALALELLLRGFLLPALAPRTGTPLAVAGIAILTGLAASDLALAPALAAIGVALCVMALESGSIVPGVALQGAVQAFVLGVSFDWGPFESAALAVAAGAAAYGLARSWDRGPRRS